jgi:glutamate-1-semialdehyde 2,1-aminomutase
MLSKPSVQKRIRETGELIIEAIGRSAKDHHVPCVVQGLGSMFQVVFTHQNKPIEHYRDLFHADVKQYGLFQRNLLEQNIHINSSGLACWFVSAAHTDEDVELTIRAIDTAMKQVAGN